MVLKAGFNQVPARFVEAIPKVWLCENDKCKNPIQDYQPTYHCNDKDCRCMGIPTNPCICSPACWRDLLNYYAGTLHEKD